jgi:hypothetical protein
VDVRGVSFFEGRERNPFFLHASGPFCRIDDPGRLCSEARENV